jgi:hypothetical protein
VTLPRALSAAVFVAVLTSGCDSSTAPGQNGHPALPVDLGDTVTGAITQAETDQFSFTPTASGYAVVFLQALDNNVVELRIDIPDSVLTESIVRASSDGDPSLVANRTPLFQVGAGIKYRIRVNAPAGVAGTLVNGAYRYQIEPIDLDPEDGPATLALGAQTVESFSGPGDYDHWTMQSGFADTVGLLFQFALQGPAVNTQISVDVYGFNSFTGNSGYFHLTSAGDTVTHTSGLILPADLTTLEVKVRMSDPANYSLLDPVLPSYLMRTTVVDMRPEVRPVMGGLLDTLITESIDSVGDVDTYRILPEVTAAYYVVAFMADQASPGDTVELRVKNAFASGEILLQSTASDTALLDHVAGSFFQWGPAFPFTVTVSASHLGQPTNHPSYRFGVMVMDTLPESVASSISVGDTITTETILFSGDPDYYTFSGTAGQVVTADLELAPQFGGIGRLDITGLGTVLPVAGAPLGTTPLTVTLPTTGTFQVRVSNYTRGRGSYRLILK